MGDPVKLAAMYEEEGADEIVFLDVSATLEGRSVLLNVLRDTASVLKIPLTVGGGMKSLVDVSAALSNGADKVSLNTWAVRNGERAQNTTHSRWWDEIACRRVRCFVERSG